MEFIPTDIPDVIHIKPDVFGDDRGFFMETYREELFAKHGIRKRFVQDNLSMSKKGTIRGLHYQIVKPQAKLVMVTRGRILDVAVDIRRSSETFGQSVQVELSGDNRELLYIPEGFAHGFEVLSEEALFMYKCGDYYYPQGERGIAWNDESLEIKWTTPDPIISGKDRNNPKLKDVKKENLFN